MAEERNYRVGRSSNQADIVLDDDTVSNLHLELTVLADGRYYLTDCNSTNGTYIWLGERWEPFQQGYVRGDERLSLGELETNVRSLLRRCEANEVSHYVRDPETGQIIKGQ